MSDEQQPAKTDSEASKELHWVPAISVDDLDRIEEITRAVIPFKPWTWSYFKEQSDESHVQDFATALRRTREHFGLQGDLRIYAVTIDEDDASGVKIALTGMSPTSENRARFIAHMSPPNVLALVDEIRGLRGELIRVREQLIAKEVGEAGAKLALDANSQLFRLITTRMEAYMIRLMIESALEQLNSDPQPTDPQFHAFALMLRKVGHHVLPLLPQMESEATAEVEQAAKVEEDDAAS